MPESKKVPDMMEAPELDLKQWGDSEVVLHEGTSEGSWIKVDESDLVPANR